MSFIKGMFTKTWKKVVLKNVKVPTGGVYSNIEKKRVKKNRVNGLINRC